MNDFYRQIFHRGDHSHFARRGLLGLAGRSFRPAMRAAVLLPATFGLAACQNPEARAAELAQQAEALAQAGNFVAARTAISQAITLREDKPDYHLLQGVISMRSGDPVGAYRAFNRALEFDATNRAALAYVANIGVQLGQVSEAEDAANKLLTLEPDAVPALQVKGMIALSRDKFEDAMKYGDRVLALSANDPSGSIIKARALAKQGHAEEALKLIDDALAGSPDSAALLTNKLNLYRYLGRAEPMLPVLDELIRSSKGAPQFRLDQINLLYRLGRPDEARKSAVALLAAGSHNPEDYRVLHRLWWEFDKSPFPEGEARNASGWKDPLAIVTTVRYLSWRGDQASADSLLRTAPDNAQPLLVSLKARLFAASGRAKEARQQVDALLAKDGHDVDALMLKARFAQQDKQFQPAIEAAQMAQTNDPLNPETYIVLAGVYRAQKANWRVRQVFEDGLKNLPQNFYLLETYTRYLHDSGDKARAISAARGFARNLPSSVRAWEIMAAQCKWAQDAACMQSAYAGYQNAKKSLIVDDPPGTAPNRGLFGRI